MVVSLQNPAAATVASWCCPPVGREELTAAWTRPGWPGCLPPRRFRRKLSIDETCVRHGTTGDVPRGSKGTRHTRGTWRGREHAPGYRYAMAVEERGAALRHLAIKVSGALGVVLMLYCVLVPRGTLQRMTGGSSTTQVSIRNRYHVYDA